MTPVGQLRSNGENRPFIAKDLQVWFEIFLGCQRVGDLSALSTIRQTCGGGSPFSMHQANLELGKTPASSSFPIRNSYRVSDQWKRALPFAQTRASSRILDDPSPPPRLHFGSWFPSCSVSAPFLFFSFAPWPKERTLESGAWKILARSNQFICLPSPA